jgi:hypothetical protein
VSAVRFAGSAVSFPVADQPSIGGVDVPSAGAIGREATVWLLDEDAAAKF